MDIHSGPQPRRESFYEKFAATWRMLAIQYKRLHWTRLASVRRSVPLIAIGIRKDLCQWLDGGVARVFQLLEEAENAAVA